MAYSVPIYTGSLGLWNEVQIPDCLRQELEGQDIETGLEKQETDN